MPPSQQRHLQPQVGLGGMAKLGFALAQVLLGVKQIRRRHPFPQGLPSLPGIGHEGRQMPFRRGSEGDQPIPDKPHQLLVQLQGFPAPFQQCPPPLQHRHQRFNINPLHQVPQIPFRHPSRQLPHLFRLNRRRQ